LDGLSGASCELVMGRTTYGRDYTESGYRRIGYGMTGAQVQKILGEPVKKRKIDDCDAEVWYFSWPKVMDANGVWGNCCYSERSLILSNGVVSVKHHEFFFD
jgi:outer membrane protein assembly factor BamE (lipoprotein component of BamABCDE complex)